MKTKSDLTKKDMADSLIALMKEKDFSEITNKEITDRAGLSHITVYRNFNSKEEIIKFYLDDTIEEFIRKNRIIYKDNLDDYIMILFDYLISTEALGKLLYRNGLIHYMRDEFDKLLSFNNSRGQRDRYYHHFITGGLYNLYYYWLKSGCKESSMELSDIFMDFCNLKRNR